MNKRDLLNLEDRVLEGGYMEEEEALRLMSLEGPDIFSLIASANRIRTRFKDNKISLCSIINAKSGNCEEDCSFCPQSIHHSAEVDPFPHVDPDKVIREMNKARNQGADRFGIVTSGKGPGEKDREYILDVLARLREEGSLHRCASLGIINREEAAQLKEAGLQEYHHNLETARSFFPGICATHEYQEDVDTIIAIKEAGLLACCGGIFGLGESAEQRVELAQTLRELDVDSIPLNFLHPIPGTPAENNKPLRPMEVLKIIAVYRFYLPDKDIKVAGGREHNLRDLQSWMFAAGANSTMVGHYLTTAGRDYRADLKMIEDLELVVLGQTEN
jgi:biotin synthase